MNSNSIKDACWSIPINRKHYKGENPIWDCFTFCISKIKQQPSRLAAEWCTWINWNHFFKLYFLTTGSFSMRQLFLHPATVIIQEAASKAQLAADPMPNATTVASQFQIQIWNWRENRLKNLTKMNIIQYKHYSKWYKKNHSAVCQENIKCQLMHDHD